MIKKNMFLIFAGFFALVISLTAMEKAYSACRKTTNNGLGVHSEECPDDPCLFMKTGDNCNYCDGTGTWNMPNGGGCNEIWLDNTRDCGNYYNGTCSRGGDCTDATEGLSCMEDEMVAAC